MDDQENVEARHALQGPHVELCGGEHAGFMPLELLVHPGEVRVEVARSSAVLGRHSRADIRLAFPEVSRRHCRVAFAAGRWSIVDLDSLNGVFINGERIHEAVLYDGDRVRIGGCVLTVVHGTPLRVIQPHRKDPQIDVLAKQAG